MSEIHLNDGEGRPVCNSYLQEPYQLENWLDNDNINCPGCIQLITMASANLFQMQTIARDISNIQKKLSDNFDKLTADEIADLAKLRRKLELEERKHHPRTTNEAYVMSLFIGDKEFNKPKNKERILNRG